ncbi:hypothetical protein IJI76_00710 [Candidatus Saccharibacteria bacterium]|nr:hypothetical protein [Candidatus Saccharibacteria bacterium]
MEGGQINQNQPAAMVNPMAQSNYVFKFLSYYFDKTSQTGTFVYQGIDNTIFTERVIFAKHPGEKEGKKFNVLNDPTLDKVLDSAMFLAFVLIGTSYYKAHPTPYVHLPKNIDEFQAGFFNKVFQEGLSQYAFENGLGRDNLAHFKPTIKVNETASLYKGNGVLSLQSGGKDSLLVSALLVESGIDFTPWYASSGSNGEHPAVIDQLFPQLTHRNASIAIRQIDHIHLKQSGGLNGHVPVTYINEALALVQAILNNQNIVLTSIGQEGNEPHSYIGDLAVNHQWSKTFEAEKLMDEYVRRYISPDIHVGSPIRKYTELRIAELFIHKCWKRYGYQFSSCNQANYKQGADNGRLSWCGECAKCANTYLLFCPFLAPQVLQSLFKDTDLFQNPNLADTFRGLLGIDNYKKPFECVGSVDELRFAYHHRMKVPPIKVNTNPSTASSAASVVSDLGSNLVEGAKRLGLNKLFKKSDSSSTPQQYNPNGNNGQYGNTYGKATAATEEIFIQPLYADLPFDVPEGNFDYAMEYESLDFFKNFFETYKAE